jgi:gas vesicle protein
MEHSNGKGNLIGGILLGAAVGAVLGVLFAPDKGSETRKKISAKGSDLTNGMKEKFNTFFDSVKNEYEAVKEKATDGVA